MRLLAPSPRPPRCGPARRRRWRPASATSLPPRRPGRTDRADLQHPQITDRGRAVGDGHCQIGHHPAAVMAAAAPFRRRHRAANPSVSPSPSASSHSNRAPVCATTPRPPVVTTRLGRPAVRFTSEVPFVLLELLRLATTVSLATGGTPPPQPLRHAPAPGPRSAPNPRPRPRRAQTRHGPDARRVDRDLAADR